MRRRREIFLLDRDLEVGDEHARVADDEGQLGPMNRLHPVERALLARLNQRVFTIIREPEQALGKIEESLIVDFDAAES